MSGIATPDGVPAERTLLAWRRTALAVTVVSAGGVRFASDALGVLAVVLGGAGIGLSLLVYAAAEVQYRQVRRGMAPRALPARLGGPRPRWPVRPSPSDPPRLAWVLHCL